MYCFTILDIDDCESGPCQNGATCIDKVADYECICVKGFTGHDCETSMLKYFGNWDIVAPFLSPYDQTK